MSATSAIRFGCQTYAWQMSRDAYRGRIDHIVEVAAGAGFAGLEPEVVMLGAYEDAALTEAVLAEHGLELAALTYAAEWRGAAETEAERAEADRAIAFLERFPSSKLALVQLPGADRANLAERQRRALSCINAVARRALAAGRTPTVHPNSPPGSVFRTAEDYAVLIDGLDEEIGFTPDVGHIVAGGMNPLEVIQRYRPRVDHIHFKDIAADGTWAPTGEGVVNFAGLVSYLTDTGYRGWIVFEDESAASERDPDQATRLNGIYARDVLAPLTPTAPRRHIQALGVRCQMGKPCDSPISGGCASPLSIVHRESGSLSSSRKTPAS